MGTSIHVIYGWEIATTSELLKWADDLDYQLPNGIILSGMDSDKIYVGAEMFATSRNVWGGTDGYSSFDQEKADNTLLNLQENNDWAIVQDHIDDRPPMFHAFANFG
jgi:hypothetical protein